MKLCELSDGYKEAADLLGKQIVRMCKLCDTSDDPQEQATLRYRIAQLRAIMTQCNDLEELTAHYYERGYKRDDKYTL